VGIRSYGISITTLEEVFLRVGEEGYGTSLEAEDQAKLKMELQAQKEKKVEEEYEFVQPNPWCITNFFNHLKAIFWKRTQILVRNRKLMFVEIGLPILLVLIGIIISKVEIFVDSQPRVLDPHLFPLKQKILVNEKLIANADSEEDNISPRELIKHLPFSEEAFESIYKDYSMFENDYSNLTKVM